ncbi:alkane 1-monooxygenase [Mycobacterium sp. MAA66]|uniref:alkane 1-monooxygenase n=1 Tax=Mycobacterium sp. MAA66 TaxID=3156297 RepID=UPI0035129680
MSPTRYECAVVPALHTRRRPETSTSCDVDGNASTTWRDPKRYLWLLGPITPGMIGLSWLLVQLTGSGAFWWTGSMLTFILMPLLDHLVGSDTDSAPDSALSRLEDDPYYRLATYLFLPTQYLSVIFACWLWAGGGWVIMTAADKLGLMVTVGTVGGIAINAAHELGHKRGMSERRLSKIALAQTCYGHFFVEHNRGHHVRVATPEDPASSRLGESLYAFIGRSVIGSLQSAWKLENERLARLKKSTWSIHNEVLNAWLLTAALFIAMTAWFGIVVLPWMIGQAVVGIFLLETVNYLEHYGLRRQKLPSGRYERVRPTHSWNSNTVIANVFLFHLQRHSDHHANPMRRYQALCHADQAPQLPGGYGTMLLLAVCPPLWRRVMDPRVLAHYGGELRLTAMQPGYEQRLRKRYPQAQPGVDAGPTGHRPGR